MPKPTIASLTDALSTEIARSDSLLDRAHSAERQVRELQKALEQAEKQTQIMEHNYVDLRRETDHLRGQIAMLERLEIIPAAPEPQHDAGFQKYM